MDMESLLGKHRLDTAAVMTRDQHGNDVAVFGMDGFVFVAKEDPDDGYRSYLLDDIDKNRDWSLLNGASIINRDVVVSWSSRLGDVLNFIDIETGHLWMELGTSEADEYYPFCVMAWHPMKKGE